VVFWRSRLQTSDFGVESGRRPLLFRGGLGNLQRKWLCFSCLYGRPLPTPTSDGPDCRNKTLHKGSQVILEGTMIQVQCLTGNSLSVINNSHCEIGEEIVQSRAQYGTASASAIMTASRMADSIEHAGHYFGHLAPSGPEISS
jgi:hypothetical protein